MEVDGFKAGFVALLGPPNAGKSSLLNALLGMRLAIVSAKPQTTRSRILGILPREGAQILFLDTPGRHRSEKKLNEALNDVVDEVARDSEVALLLVDRAVGWTDVHDEIAAALEQLGRPTIVVGTLLNEITRPIVSAVPPKRRRLKTVCTDGTSSRALASVASIQTGFPRRDVASAVSTATAPASFRRLMIAGGAKPENNGTATAPNRAIPRSAASISGIIGM